MATDISQAERGLHCGEARRHRRGTARPRRTGLWRRVAPARSPWLRLRDAWASSHPLVYKYFPSLHAINDPIIARGTPWLAHYVDEAVDELEPGLERLLQGNRAFLRWSMLTPGPGAPVVLPPDPGLRAAAASPTRSQRTLPIGRGPTRKRSARATWTSPRIPTRRSACSPHWVPASRRSSSPTELGATYETGSVHVAH